MHAGSLPETPRRAARRSHTTRASGSTSRAARARTSPARTRACRRRSWLRGSRRASCQPYSSGHARLAVVPAEGKKALALAVGTEAAAVDMPHALLGELAPGDGVQVHQPVS